jgi:hypothetical protein
MRQGGEMTRSMIKIGLGMCFKDMARTGRELSETAFRFAAALELAEAETDPARKAEYLKQAQGLRWSLRDYYIKDYLRRATQATGNDNQDPGAYPALRDRFRELKDLPLETDEELVDAAGRLLRTMSEVLTQPEKILEEAVHDAFSRRQSVDLPLPDDAPPEDEGDTTTG